MRKAVIFFFCLFLSISEALALTEAEYRDLVESSREFREADEEMARRWKEIYGSFPKADKAWLMENQREWLATGREKAAAAFMARGASRGEAYARAARMRVKDLDIIENNATREKMRADGYNYSPEERAVWEDLQREENASGEAPSEPASPDRPFSLEKIFRRQEIAGLIQKDYDTYLKERTIASKPDTNALEKPMHVFYESINDEIAAKSQGWREHALGSLRAFLTLVAIEQAEIMIYNKDHNILDTTQFAEFKEALDGSNEKLRHIYDIINEKGLLEASFDDFLDMYHKRALLPARQYVRTKRNMGE